jgi:hypothetical protein
MNEEIGTECAIPFLGYLFRIFGIVSLQSTMQLSPPEPVERVLRFDTC